MDLIKTILAVGAGNIWGFAGYMSISVIAGVSLVALGYFLVRLILCLSK